MEIHNTLLQALSQTIAGAGDQLRGTGQQLSELTPEYVGSAPDQMVLTEEVPDLGQAVRSSDSAQLLSTGEQEILDLFFNDEGASDQSVYGPQSPKPALLGNFLDVRG
ncbi:MAG: hypothetical protein JSU61_03540 [Fidelibacterota bacterium]|nr:MAG: hypothetical protein JSU61_03540 [Candidatus Neomarinimicrobiota bacterium]